MNNASNVFCNNINESSLNLKYAWNEFFLNSFFSSKLSWTFIGIGSW
jgi:hypothetical protein